MKRELSVEDLFDPLNRLDVHRVFSSSRGMKSLVNSAFVNGGSSEAFSEDVERRTDCLESRYAQADLEPSSDSLGATALIPEGPIMSDQGERPYFPFLSLPKDRNSGDPVLGMLGVYAMDENNGYIPKDLYKEGKEKNNARDNENNGTQVHGLSTSDEEQQIVDDRKQRRMLSNRESARRSRLRKQQHLDELRDLIAQLQVQYSQMLNSFNIASQQFAQVTEENRQLRFEAMDLNHQLKQLHHLMSTNRSNIGFIHEVVSKANGS